MTQTTKIPLHKKEECTSLNKCEISLKAETNK